MPPQIFGVETEVTKLSCGCSGSTWQTYVACSGVPIAQQFADDNTLLNIAASAGARSQDWTLCVAMAFLKTRRFIYSKTGGCGSTAIDVSGLTAAEIQLEGSGAKAGAVLAATGAGVIPGAIISGISSIFGIFTQAHIQAVQTEETTLCQVAIRYNQFIQSIEQAVASGRLSPSDAAAFMDGLIQQLDPVLAGIAKVCCGVGRCDAACGYRFALRALQAYNDDYVFPGLAPSNPISGFLNSISPPSPPPSYEAPGTSNNPGQSVAPPATGVITGAVPTIVPTSISLPGGGQGLILVGGGLIAARALGAI